MVLITPRADLAQEVSQDVERLSPRQGAFSHGDPLHWVRVHRLLVHLRSRSHVSKRQRKFSLSNRAGGGPCLQGRCRAPAPAWGHLSVWSGSPPGPPGTPEPGGEFRRSCSCALPSRRGSRLALPAQGCWWRCRPGWGRSRRVATRTRCFQTASAPPTRNTSGWDPGGTGTTQQLRYDFHLFLRL